MNGLVLEDLSLGLHEWRNIQDVVRAAFQIHEEHIRTIVNQLNQLTEISNKHEKDLETKVGKTDLQAALSLKCSQSEVNNINKRLSDLNRVLETKADNNELIIELNKKANIQDVAQKFAEQSNLLQDKADSDFVRRQLEKKLSVTELHNLESSLSKKANVVDVEDGIQQIVIALEQRPTSIEVREWLDSKANISDMSDALNLKANKRSIANALASKATKENLEELKSSLISRIEQNDTIISSVVDGKADKEWVLRVLAEKSVEKRNTEADVRNILEGKATKSELEQLVQVTIQTQKDLALFVEHGKEQREQIDIIKQRISKLEQQFYSDLQDMQERTQQIQKNIDLKIGTNQKELHRQIQKELNSLQGNLDELTTHLTQTDYIDRSQLREDLSKVEERFKENCKVHTQTVENNIKMLLEEFRERLENKVDKQDLAKLLLEKVSILELESVTKSSEGMREIIRTVRDQLTSKVSLDEVATMLQKKAGIDDIRKSQKAILEEVQALLEQKPDTEEVNRILKQKADISELNTILERKSDINEIEHVVKEFKGNFQILNSAIDEQRDAVLKIQTMLNTGHPAVQSLYHVIEEIKKEVILKSNIKDVMMLLDVKANTDDVNQALETFQKQITDIVTKKKEKVSSILPLSNIECGDLHIEARWIWCSAKIKSHGIPWNVQVINTCPTNFVWEKDKVNIVIVAPGLYEITFGLFNNTKKKPAVQLMVNGEPIMSAINSSSYVLHHSSGRLATTSALHGLTLIDFLVLPEKARIAFTISEVTDENIEAFFGIRFLGSRN